MSKTCSKWCRSSCTWKESVTLLLSLWFLGFFLPLWYKKRQRGEFPYSMQVACMILKHFYVHCLTTTTKKKFRKEMLPLLASFYCFSFCCAVHCTYLLLFYLCLVRFDKCKLERLPLSSQFYLDGPKWTNT